MKRAIGGRWLNSACSACLIGTAAMVAPASCWAQGYTITTIAGGCSASGTPAASNCSALGDGNGDGGPAVAALLLNPAGMVIDSAGNLSIPDANLSVSAVCEVSPSGIISTIAGISFQSGYSGDGGPATNAELSGPNGLALDSAGNLYIADT